VRRLLDKRRADVSDNYFGAVLEAFTRLDIDAVEEGQQLEADLGMDSQEIVILACELEAMTGAKWLVGLIKRNVIRRQRQ
jgi:hypothetical protein